MRQRHSRVETLDPANTCSHCPHAVIALPRSGTLWCPCEDCHAGGLIQGREPKDNHTVAARQPAVTSTEDSPLWVDPIHSV